MTILRANNLKKVYTTRFGAHHVQALANVSFSVEQGEYVAIMGESGSGKTTLLNILAALDKPTSGEVWLGDRQLGDIPERELAAFRRDNLGFVFQEFNLLDTFCVRDNIYRPLVLKRMAPSEMAQLLKPIARKLGIDRLLAKYPYEISGGEKQRTAVARALITSPKLILADEPTGALPAPPIRCSISLARSIRRDKPSSWSRTRSRPPAMRAGCCFCATAWCSTSFIAAALPNTSFTSAFSIR